MSMSRKIIILLVLALLALVAAIIVWKWTFKKSETNVASKNADVEIAAGALVHEFEQNEDIANTRYLGKVIVVSGTVGSITEDEQGISVYLMNEEDMSGVMCTISKGTLESVLISKGDQVKIKGLCDGYLMDVKLNKCSLEK
jgi:hypothetical protein